MLRQFIRVLIFALPVGLVLVGWQETGSLN